MRNLLIVVCSLLFCAVFDAALGEGFGLKIPEHWEEGATFLSLPRAPLPLHFDWREKLHQAPPILNQGQCGSCWAHSRVSTLAWQKLIQGQVFNASPQELVSCDTQEMGCSGGFWDDYEVTTGISQDSEFPYVAADVRCRSGLSHEGKITKWLFVGSQGRSPSTEEIKQAIFQYGPVGVTVGAQGQFMSYHGGVMKGCPHGNLNHMILALGWDDTKGVLYLQNSWGTGWGEKGYAQIKYGCYSLADQAAVPVL